MPACGREGGGGGVAECLPSWAGQGEGPPGDVFEKRSERMKGGKQMTVGLSCWCASPWAPTSLPFVRTGTDLESAVR